MDDHPTDRTLGAYGLGQLDDASSAALVRHLRQCPDCRNRVAVMSADSFPDPVRDARKPSGTSQSGPSRPGGSSSDPGSTTPVPPPAGTLPPGLADHPDYEVRKELGRGGMGVVYLAHNRLLGRDEVLKVMGRHIMERPGVLDRFLREMRAVARLRHPNIVTAYSAMRLGESLVFAMEYVEGLDLSRMVKAKGPLPVGHACNFVHQAALGLQHAHEEGLVHRDIKPGNLMLAKKGEKPVVKVLDFGLSKVAREEKVDGGLTSVGQALGTPDFIAPEQILDAPSADVRADIYSLGGTLYYLLTGSPPFRASSLYDMYQAHISRDAEPLNFVRPEVPAELAALVGKMMAKDPARRFQTPGEVAQALTPFFRKSGAAVAGRRTEVSQVEPATAGRSSSGPVPPPARPAAAAARPAARAGQPAEATAAASRWEGPVEAPGEGRSVDAAPAVGPTRRPPWLWPSVAAGVLVLGCVAAWLVVPKRDTAVVQSEPRAPGEFGAGESSPEVDELEPRLSRKTRALLEKKVPLNFSNGTPLEDALKYIKEQTREKDTDPGVPIYVDPVGLQEAEKTTTSPVTIDVENTALGDSLERMLKQLGLAYGVKYGMICITHANDIEDFLDELGFVPFAPGNDAAQSRPVVAKLDQAVPMNFPNETPLEDVLKYVKSAADWKGVDVYVDPVGLQEAEKTMTSPVALDLEGVPLKCTLQLALKQLGLTYLVKNGGLTITSRSSADVVASPDGKAPTAWKDDLSNGSHWSIIGGMIRGRTGEDNGAPAIIHTQRDDFGDVLIRLKVLNVDNKSGYVVVHRAPAENAFDQVSGYVISVGGTTSGRAGTVPPGSIAEAAGVKPGEVASFAALAPRVAVKVGAWQAVEIRVTGRTIATTINDRKAAEYTDPDGTYPAGTIALACRAGSSLKVKDVSIEELSGAEPVR